MNCSTSVTFSRWTFFFESEWLSNENLPKKTRNAVSLIYNSVISFDAFSFLLILSFKFTFLFFNVDNKQICFGYDKIGFYKNSSNWVTTQRLKLTWHHKKEHPSSIHYVYGNKQFKSPKYRTHLITINSFNIHNLRTAIFGDI